MERIGTFEVEWTRLNSKKHPLVDGTDSFPIDLNDKIRYRPPTCRALVLHVLLSEDAEN
ncbi:MAG TPA: hypothetical protein VJ249_07185 [Candidatus Bathyarchaeia archaeon]|nr:hypothetical protein [Candidatus Bathyarchaeia archaeon]